MMKIACALALSGMVACTKPAATTPGQPPVPKETWEKILRDVALASLRAVVCTEPLPAEVPAEVQPVTPAPSPAPGQPDPSR